MNKNSLGFEYKNKFFKMGSLRPILFIFILVFYSCGLVASRPKLEMGLAAAAFIAATNAKANVLAPNLYRKAEVYYLKARSSYGRKYFNKAKQYALLSKKFSERAEFVAVRKATLDGDGGS